MQYFEIVGNRAIYKDGWWAACKLDRIPWDLSPPTMARLAPGTYDPEQDTWELYYLPDDFSRRKDLAAENPEKLAELKELFWEEAEKHNVLPLLAAFSVFFGILPPMPTVTTQTFYGDVQNIASGMIPRVYGRSYAIEAELSVPDEGAEGVIVAEGDEMGGFSLWVDEDGLLHHSYSTMGVEQYEQVSTEPIPTGDVTVGMQFDADRQERGAGGTVSLYANDEKIGEGRMESTVAVRFTAYAGMDVGRDNGLPVDRAYAAKSPYPFTGTVKKVVYDLKPGTHDDEKALHEEGAHVAAAHGISALGGGGSYDPSAHNRRDRPTNAGRPALDARCSLQLGAGQAPVARRRRGGDHSNTRCSGREALQTRQAGGARAEASGREVPRGRLERGRLQRG